MIQEGDAVFLNKSIAKLEEDFEDLKNAYEKKDYDKFNELKKKVMITQKAMAEAAR